MNERTRQNHADSGAMIVCIFAVTSAASLFSFRSLATSDSQSPHQMTRTPQSSQQERAKQQANIL